ncbi:MAG: phosphoenolpyruvate--protein phosphotransferase [Burkholderiales bacterium]|nr:phosphoenolpyruvate--protein phosphotransferase [Burkholderiales bacterium]
MSIQVFGLPVSRGVAIGRAVLIASSRVDVAHYYIDLERVPDEVARLRHARDTVVEELTTLKRDLPADAPAELAALLDVHLMLLHDEILAGATKHWIEARHYNAEWALSAQTEVLARQFDEMEDEYLRERKGDIEQVAERVQRALSKEGSTLPLNGGRSGDLGGEDPLVLVANDIAPADMMQFKGSVFTGFVTDVGGRTSHTAIVARSMDIPAVVGAREVSRLVRQDDWVIIDGDAGVVVVDPPPIVLEEYRFRQRQGSLERARLDRLRYTPSITLDGQAVELLANIEQPEAYRAAVEAMKGLPVTIRTVDVGADKPLERTSGHEHALNPSLGLRAIRWSLSEPTMFRQQLRAILRASAHGKVKMLIPMVAHHSEVRATLEAIGAMIEVPAAAMIMPLLMRHFDFVSIGTNDLIQYTLAIDRADEAVAHLYDPWHPAVLRLIANVIAAAGRCGKPVSVCGEMAGDVEFTEVLLAMGLRSLSMHPTQISSVKQRILRADTARLAMPLEAVLASDEPALHWRAALERLSAAAH